MRFKDKGFTPITDRDFKVVQFLWKWKVSTTAALTLKFFPNCAPNTAYNRLLRLEKMGVIMGRADPTGNYFVWTLTADGNARNKRMDTVLRDTGYRSEYPSHDLLVAAVHNGDWFWSLPENVEVFTEQQIRRYAVASYPSWVPPLDYHRPDGYWRLKKEQGSYTVALEVELHQKAKADYSKAALFYQFHRSVQKVLWVIPKISGAERLTAVLTEKGPREWNPHIFTTVAEFEKQGWQAPILFGEEKGRTIAEVLGAKSQNPIGVLTEGGGNTVGRLPKQSLTTSMLNVAKSPHKSMSPKFFPIPGSANSMGV